MKFKSLIWRALLALTLFYLNPAFAATTAGVIELIEGDVKITRSDNAVLEPIVGDSVEEGDSVVTGANGELHVVMQDSGFIAVRPNTVMKIEQYRAEGDKDDKSVLSLLKGTFRSITGWIGKYSRDNYRITSPSGTIGIRGTDHEPLYIPQSDHGAEGEPGLYDKVNQGETFIQNPQGKIFVKANQSGFVPHRGQLAPKLLPGIPKFFRATRNEQAIERKRDIVKQQIEKRRLERRQYVRQKRTAERKKIMQERQKRGESLSGTGKRRIERRGQLKQNEESAERRRFTEEDKKQNRSKQRRSRLEENDRDDGRPASAEAGSHGGPRR